MKAAESNGHYSLRTHDATLFFVTTAGEDVGENS